MAARPRKSDAPGDKDKIKGKDKIGKRFEGIRTQEGDGSELDDRGMVVEFRRVRERCTHMRRHDKQKRIRLNGE